MIERSGPQSLAGRRCRRWARRGDDAGDDETDGGGAAACSTDPDIVLVTTAPEVVSSIEANPGETITLYALAQALSGNLAAADPVVLTVDPDPTP